MSSRLDEIKARHAMANLLAVGEVKVWDSMADIPALVAAVEAVLELHQQVGSNQYPDCVHCSDDFGNWPVAYPCPTVVAIRQALGEVEQ